MFDRCPQIEWILMSFEWLEMTIGYPLWVYAAVYTEIQAIITD